ncbi:Transcription elongation protein nusA [Anaerococcus prevotii]|uniref:Transcription termination/antitermination protein NusA n=1 Tax=Anaerococcus prevotii (strain ATCC 9321 / DSM 20548 / JCM 6508 / NCTC 11806 / PC1) TaxID=525919 RepID=C7RGN8_ANAPD|nr:transcription termination factor NusA [Anaerococcus prevotii]ACV28649.1 NusA antitermination factor [Anaerococcus prevotii DSM 20548]SUU94211.1 Transcription elongation protein nusA [Anaerococcus prevotii]
MNNDFMLALDELCKEKNLDKATILDALQKALIKSYQKNYDNEENVDVIIDEETGQIEVFALKEVVDEVDDTITEISLKDALEENSSYHLGDIARIKLTPKNFGRVAAQTARNIVIQKIRDAQRDSLYGEYIERANEMITGTIQRQDKYNVYVNLDKIEGVVPIKEQVPTEEYPANAKMKFLIKEVRNSSKEPQIVLSRSSQDLITRLFELEVPEITDGIIEIYSLAREAGSRTKMAVFSNDEGIDAVGACIGFKGIRVNSIVEELQGEKIDIINFDKDIKVFISNALSPADIIEVLVNEKSKKSLVVVSSDQLSLAIGKEGQNARLAARLTGWKIDIKSSEEYESLSQEEIDEILGLNEIDEEASEVADEDDALDDEDISLDLDEENDDTEDDLISDSEVEEIIEEESDDTVEDIANIDSTVKAYEEDESNED